MRRTLKLTPPASHPDFVSVEVVDSADGGYCLVAGGVRIAGCEPTLHENNVRYRWNVPTEQLRQYLRRSVVKRRGRTR